MLPKNPYGSSTRRATSPCAMRAPLRDIKNIETIHSTRRALRLVPGQPADVLDRWEFIVAFEFFLIKSVALAMNAIDRSRRDILQRSIMEEPGILRDLLGSPCILLQVRYC